MSHPLFANALAQGRTALLDEQLEKRANIVDRLARRGSRLGHDLSQSGANRYVEELGKARLHGGDVASTAPALKDTLKGFGRQDRVHADKVLKGIPKQANLAKLANAGFDAIKSAFAGGFKVPVAGAGLGAIGYGGARIHALTTGVGRWSKAEGEAAMHGLPALEAKVGRTGAEETALRNAQSYQRAHSRGLVTHDATGVAKWAPWQGRMGDYAHAVGPDVGRSMANGGGTGALIDMGLQGIAKYKKKQMVHSALQVGVPVAAGAAAFGLASRS